MGRLFLCLRPLAPIATLAAAGRFDQPGANGVQFMPATSLNPSSDVCRELRGGHWTLPGVSESVAARAGRHDVAGSVAAAVASSDDVFGSKTEAAGLPQCQPVLAAEADGVSRPHPAFAVVAVVAL